MRVNAEEINFNGYFANSRSHEPVSQWWANFLDLDKNADAGCYMYLADFGAAKILHPKEDYPDGLFAFYFGRTDRVRGSIIRGDKHFTDPKDKSSLCGQLIQEMEDRVPVVQMCTLISVAEGRGALESSMFLKYNFFANVMLNGGYGPKVTASEHFETFKQACLAVKKQRDIVHSDLFHLASSSYAPDLNLLTSVTRSICVRMQDMHLAIDAAEAGQLDATEREACSTALSYLEDIYLTVVPQLESVSDGLVHCNAALVRSSPSCSKFYECSAVPKSTGASTATRYLSNARDLQNKAWSALSQVAVSAKQFWLQQLRAQKKKSKQTADEQLVSTKQNARADSSTLGSKDDPLMAQITEMMRDEDGNTLLNLLELAGLNHKLTHMVESHLEKVLCRHIPKVKEILRQSGIPLLVPRTHQKCKGWEDFVCVLAQALLDESSEVSSGEESRSEGSD